MELGLTTSQVSNSWDLEIFIESLDATFCSRCSHTREVMAQVKRASWTSLPRHPIGWSDLLDTCHDESAETLLPLKRINGSETSTGEAKKVDRDRKKLQQWGFESSMSR
jgi:hypothetical protein